MIVDKIALILAIVGGLNWGSIGIFGFDLVAFSSAAPAAPSAGWSIPWWVWPPCGASPSCSGTPPPPESGPKEDRRPFLSVWTAVFVCLLHLAGQETDTQRQARQNTAQPQKSQGRHLEEEPAQDTGDQYAPHRPG